MSTKKTDVIGFWRSGYVKTLVNRGEVLAAENDRLKWPLFLCLQVRVSQEGVAVAETSVLGRNWGFMVLMASPEKCTYQIRERLLIW